MLVVVVDAIQMWYAFGQCTVDMSLLESCTHGTAGEWHVWFLWRLSRLTIRSGWMLVQQITCLMELKASHRGLFSTDFYIQVIRLSKWDVWVWGTCQLWMWCSRCQWWLVMGRGRWHVRRGGRWYMRRRFIYLLNVPAKSCSALCTNQWCNRKWYSVRWRSWLVF